MNSNSTKFRGHVLAAAVAIWMATSSSSLADAISAKTIRPDRELFITASAVVDSYQADYPGAWSFGTLIREAVGEEHASTCVRDWLETWKTGDMMGDEVVPPRPAIVEKIIAPWQQRDGYKADSETPWLPKLENAPFRLCAIVNRMDLCAPELAQTSKQIEEDWKRRGREREFQKLMSRVSESLTLSALRATSGYGGGPPSTQDFVTAGQGRFIFAATDPDGKPLPGNWTVIFEYQLPSTTLPTHRDWASAWHALGAIDPNEHEYVLALEQITRRFTHRATAPSQGVALAQIRTSEAAFHSDREFREYKLEGSSLKLAPLPLTPSFAFTKKKSREQDALGDFLHDQDPLIRSGLHLFPQSLGDRKGSMQLAAARAVIPGDEPNFHWEFGPKVSRESRRIMSLNTCNGCHAGETGCRDGVHVHSRNAWEPAQLSEFLRSDNKPLRLSDPVGQGAKIEYHEMADRAAILAALLEPVPRRQLDELRDVLHARLRRSH